MKVLVSLLLGVLTVSFAKDIRFFNSIPTSSMTISFPPLPSFEVEYGKATLYEPVIGDSATFNITKTNQPSYFVHSGEVSLSFSKHYTFVSALQLNNTNPANATIFLKAFFEDLVNPPNWTPGQALVRFIHLAPLVGPVSIQTGNRVIFLDLLYGVDTTYFALNSATPTTFDITSQNESRQYTASLLQPNTMYTIFITSPSLESSANETGFASAQFWLVFDRNYTVSNNQSTSSTNPTSTRTASSSTNTQNTRSTQSTNTQSSQSSQSSQTSTRSESTPGSQTRSESSTNLGAHTTSDHAVSSGMHSVLSVLVFLVCIALL